MGVRLHFLFYTKYDRQIQLKNTLVFKRELHLKKLWKPTSQRGDERPLITFEELKKEMTKIKFLKLKEEKVVSSYEMKKREEIVPVQIVGYRTSRRKTKYQYVFSNGKTKLFDEKQINDDPNLKNIYDHFQKNPQAFLD